MMQFKPLLLMIPCVFVLAVLLLVDSPLPESSAASAGEDLIKVESRKEESSPAVVSEKKEGKTESEEEKKDKISMTLVVGQTGDLKKGGYEPVYEAPVAAPVYAAPAAVQEAEPVKPEPVFTPEPEPIPAPEAAPEAATAEAVEAPAEPEA